MAARHEVLGGKVQLYLRPDGRYWQCSCTINGKQYRASTKKEGVREAEDVAEEWYLELKGMFKRGEMVQPLREKTFAEVAEQFLREFSALTEGQRNPKYVKNHRRRVENYLVPFMGDKPISEITSGVVQDYRLHRIEQHKAKMAARKRDEIEEETEHQKAKKSTPARGTIHQEIVVIRQVLKTALRHRWIAALPDLSEPYRLNLKVSHRAWFSPEEYRTLYTETKRCAKNPPNPRFAWEYKQLHDLVLFLANTGLRPDEAARLQFRDVSVVDDDRSGETILVIECRGKRGYGPCKSTAGAVRVFRRLQKRNQPLPTDRIFPVLQTQLFNKVLARLDLKYDREGRPRTLYSLRHTYISFRLLEGANVLQLAWNCRTSVDMIEKYYATHIKTRLDASAINVRRGATTESGKPGFVAANDNGEDSEEQVA